jgi:hypothetical protein
MRDSASISAPTAASGRRELQSVVALFAPSPIQNILESPDVPAIERCRTARRARRRSEAEFDQSTK